MSLEMEILPNCPQRKDSMSANVFVGLQLKVKNSKSKNSRVRSFSKMSLPSLGSFKVSSSHIARMIKFNSEKQLKMIFSLIQQSIV